MAAAAAPSPPALARAGARARAAPRRAGARCAAAGGGGSGGGGARATQRLLESLLGAAAGAAARAAADAVAEASVSAAEDARRREEAPGSARAPPGPPGDIAPQLLADPLAFLDGLAKEHGDVVGATLASERVVFVGAPDAADSVLVTQSSSFVKEGTAFFPGSSLAGEGLLVSDGDTWRRQRRLSNPAFRAAAVQRYAGAMGGAADEMLSAKWGCPARDGTSGAGLSVAAASGTLVRDVYADFNELTLDVVARALFGADLRSDGAAVQAAVAEAFEHFASRAATGFAVPEWAPTPDNARYAIAVRELDRVVYGLIARRREAVARGGAEAAGSDLLGDLLRATDDEDAEGDGQGMGDKALRDELMTLMVAGQETSAIVLAWACAFLMDRPEMQERIAREVAAAGGEAAVGEAAGSGGLPFTEAVLYECMRLRPPAYMVGRCAAEDVSLESGGTAYSVPRGTTVLVSPWLLHRDERWWGESALDFDPDRWLKSEEEAKRMRVSPAYVPFGAGPRVCIGARFAMIEGLVVLATLCARARLSPARFAPRPKPGALITLRPAGAVELTVTPREPVVEAVGVPDALAGVGSGAGATVAGADGGAPVASPPAEVVEVAG